MANLAYVRVSTVEQNEERQIEGLKVHNIDRWFIDKMSGKNTDRPQLKEMMKYAREGDTIFIHDLSRLARNTLDLLKMVEDLDKREIRLVSNKENIDTSTATGKLMLTMIGAIAEFERNNLKERQAEGIALAKAAGVYKGRKSVEDKKEVMEKFSTLYEKYMSREINKTQFAKELEVSRPTLDRLIKNHEEKNQ